MAYILKNGARPNGSEVRNIKVGDSEIKYIITGGGSLFYDIQHYIEYDIPELTFLYPDTVIPAEGGKLKPSVLEFKQKWRRVGYSGNKYELEIIIEGADIQYHVLSGEDISVDENGEVTWESRDITFDENERTAVIQMTVIINGLENHTTATVRLAKNIIEKIDYSEPIGKNLTVLDIPAKGGMITSGVTDGTITLIQTDTYSSKELNSYEINPDIMSDYYSDPVIADNLLSNITKRSIVGTLTYYYNCNGITGQCSADVYLLANIVESIEIRENSLQYDDIAAGDTLATPITSDAPRFYFTSEEYSDVIPSKQYGEFVEYISYLLDSYINGFVGCDYSTGQLYATSRGTEYGSDYRVSGTVNKLVTYNWYPISHEYGDFKEISGSTSASCKLEPNLIVELTLENLDAGYINLCDYFAASEETKVITNGSSASTQCLVTFSSNDSTYEYQNWVNINIDYDWVSDKDYVYITSFEESCLVTMESRGTDYDSNSRSATINRIANIEASLKSGYVYAPSVSDSVSCNVDIYQKPNNITITNITVNPGTIDNPGIYIAKGETKSINSSQASTAVGTLTFDSGDSVPASTTYGLWKGPNYSWSSDKDYVSCSSIGNFESINVTMDNRTIIEGPLRDATITRNVTWEYELKNSYGGGSDYKDSSTTVVIYQEANIADVRSEITEYGIPDISIDSTNLTAAGGYCTIYSSVTNIRTYYYTSESPGRTIEEPGEVGLLIDAQYFSTSSGATFGTNITRFDLNGVIISHDDMTTNDGYDFVTIRSVNKLSIDYYKLETTSVLNQKDYSNKITTYGDVEFDIGTGLTASGGKALLTYSQVNTRTYYYTSNSISRTEDEYGEVNISITRQTLSSTLNHGSTNISRFSINGDATFLLHLNMTNNITYDVVTVKATGEGGKSTSITTSVKNIANATNEITTYGEVMVTINGGLEAYDSDTTISYSQTNTRTYYYTSGTISKTEQEPGSVILDIYKQTLSSNTSHSSTNISRYSLNGNVLNHASMETTAGYDVITVVGYGTGSKVGYDTTYVRNIKDDYSLITTYNKPEISLINNNLSAAGGLATVSYSQTNIRTWYYTSGAISRTENVSGNVSIDISKQTLSSTTSHGSTNITRYSLNKTTDVLSHTSMTNKTTYDVVTIKATGEGSMTNTYTTYVKNVANASNAITEYGVPEINIDNTYLTAAGGYCTISSSVTNVRTYYYTSNYPGKTEEEPGLVSLSILSQYFSTSSTATTGTSISRYSISGTKLSHSSMDKNAGYDHVVIKATNIGDLTKTNTASTKILNVKDATSLITSYGDVTISIDSSKLTAGGGYCTVTYGLTNIKTWYYTSNSISRTENISGSVTIAIDKLTLSSSSTSHGSTNISRYSRNGNILNHTTMGANVGYDVVTVKATGEGGKTNSATTSIRNRANDSSAITEYGVPSVSIGSLYAYESETTVTYSAKNTKTYYYTSGTAGTTEQVAASVTAEMITNGNNRFTFTNPGLKHASMGTSATTDKVVIKVTNNGDTSKTNTASKSITNYADASYNTPEITGYSYALFPTEGGAKYPSVSYRLYSYYTSGSRCNTYTSGGSLTYLMSPNPSNGFTLSTNGKMTAAENTITSDRSPSSMPEVYVTMKGKTSDWYTCTYCVLEKVKIRYVINEITLSFTAAGGTKYFTPTYTVYEGDVAISSGNLTGYTITKIALDDVFTRSGTSISVGVNESSYMRYDKYQITCSGYTTNYIYCKLNGDGFSYYDVRISTNNFTSDYPCSEDGGSCTITAKVYEVWESGKEYGPYKPTLSSNHDDLTISTLNNNYKATAKWGSNNRGDYRSGSITASYGGYSNYVTLYQYGLHIIDEELVASFYYDEGKPNYTSSNSVTPKFDYIKHYVYWSDGDHDVYNLLLSDCYDYYSFISGDTSHFTLTRSNGKVKFKTVNKSGDERRATVECELEYISPYTGNYVYSYPNPTADVVLESYYYYLTLVNPYNKDVYAIICYGYTPATPEAHGEITEEAHLVPAGESFKIDVTKGILVNVGPNGSVTTKTSDCLLTIYFWDKENMVYSGNLDFIMHQEGLTHGL